MPCEYPVSIDYLFDFKIVNRRISVKPLIKRMTGLLFGDQFINGQLIVLHGGTRFYSTI